MNIENKIKSLSKDQILEINNRLLFEDKKGLEKVVSYQFPEISNNLLALEEAVQYLLFEYKIEVPFPPPNKPKFNFVDLFAGIGGMRLALQNLGGKCHLKRVFTTIPNFLKKVA